MNSTVTAMPKGYTRKVFILANYTAAAKARGLCGFVKFNVEFFEGRPNQVYIQEYDNGLEELCMNARKFPVPSLSKTPGVFQQITTRTWMRAVDGKPYWYFLIDNGYNRDLELEKTIPAPP